MSLRFQTALQDLADKGITADKLTADEIEALVFACERVNNPFADINADLVDIPTRVCRGVFLWPMTAGAQIWLTEYAERWWPKGSAMYRWAQVYALQNSRRSDAFSRLTTRSAARLAIIRSGLRLVCHRRELAEAVNRCYGVHPHDAEPPATPRTCPDEIKTDFAHFVAMLEVSSGIRASHWLWGRSLVAIMQTYYKHRTLISASALGGGNADEMTFELNDALQNLATVKSRIIERIENGK